jgi:hypothetical protein
MARNLASRRKKPMGTAVTAPNRRKSAAEEKLVNDLLKISRRVFDKLSPAEREARLRKLNAYLASLEGSVAKRA